MFDGRDVLFKASEWLLEEPGRWVTGTYWADIESRRVTNRKWANEHFEKVGACAVGAIALWADRLADNRDDSEQLAEQAQHLLNREIGAAYPAKNMSITHFNDLTASSGEEVAAMMRNAAS